MQLKILSLNKVEYEGEVAGLNVKTESGEITVLNGHRPLVSVLVPGTAQIMTSDNKRLPFNIRSGFLEMDGDNRLNLLVD